MELPWLPLKPGLTRVIRSSAGPIGTVHPGQRLLRSDLQQHRGVRHKATRRGAVERPYVFKIKCAPVTLVGDGRISVPVRDHHAARVQRRANHVLYKLRARSLKQEQL